MSLGLQWNNHCFQEHKKVSTSALQVSSLAKRPHGLRTILKTTDYASSTPYVGLFQIISTLLPLNFGRGTEKGKRQNIMEKVLTSLKTRMQRVGTWEEGQEETFPLNSWEAAVLLSPGAYNLWNILILRGQVSKRTIVVEGKREMLSLFCIGMWFISGTNKNWNHFE